MKKYNKKPPQRHRLTIHLLTRGSYFGDVEIIDRTRRTMQAKCLS